MKAGSCDSSETDETVSVSIVRKLDGVYVAFGNGIAKAAAILIEAKIEEGGEGGGRNSYAVKAENQGKNDRIGGS